MKNGDLISFIKRKDYEVIDANLGSGSFGKTVLIKDPYIDELFVVKKYEPDEGIDVKEFYQSFLQEIKIMYKLNHPNVARIFGYYAYDEFNTGYIIMEYIDGNTIDMYFDENGIEDANTVFTQLIDGFVCLENEGILHRDIREGNIMVDKNGIAKIIDFGLGKTFMPVAPSLDSKAAIINRYGVEKLPNELYDGKYYHQTDMFYLGELYNRLIHKHENTASFSYQPILTRMMEADKDYRYNSFSDVKEALGELRFSILDINQDDKDIYQRFATALYRHLGKFANTRGFITDVETFESKLNLLISHNCFEDCIQNNDELLSTIITGRFSYYSKAEVDCKIVTDFYRWFERLAAETKKLVMDNLIAKLSIKEVEIDDDLPF